MLPALLLVASAACGTWHDQAAGHYLGQVESQGPKAVDTWLGASQSGLLAGRYVLHEPTRDVEGTLEYLGDDGCDAALFAWRDIYGAGVARLRFDLERRCFEGEWGLDRVRPALYWRSCAQAAVTS